MAILQLLQQLLTTKATAVLAAFALVGGGAAIAAPEIGDGSADDEPAAITELDPDVVDNEDENGWAIGRVDEGQMDRIAAFCVENPEASFCSGDSQPGLPVPSDEEETEEVEDTEDTEDTEKVEGEGDAGIEQEEDTRSDTARRVHRALTGTDDIVPGDPDFGRTVSERARSGQPGDLGRLVSGAAQGDDLDDEGLKLDDRQPRTSGQEGDEGEAGDEDDDQSRPEASGRPANAGPPDGTPAASRSKGRGGR